MEAGAGERSVETDGKWWTLGAVCLGMFMLLLDITIVNVALPRIRTDLGSSFSDLQWVVDAYALSLASLLLTAGSLADLLGRRKVFAWGLVVFTAASVGCGLANSPLALNLARAVQGIGGSVMFATSLALIAAAFSGRERGTAFGLYGATIGGAVAIGPLVGGVLTEWIGWEWIFFVNVPVGAVALFVTLTRVAESRDPEATGVDWAGLVTFSTSLFLLVFALVRANTEGWNSPLIVSFLVGSAVLMAAFVVVERRQKRPMFDLTLFRKPAFTGAALVGFALSAGMFSMFLYLTLYLQGVLGYEPLQAGLRFLPTTLLSFFVAPLAGRLSVRVPVRLLLGGGLLLVATGLLLLGGLEPGSSWTELLPGFLLTGTGIGFVNAPLVSTAVAVVEPARSGMASGINNTFRQVGIATGTAALGAIFSHVVIQKTSEALARVPGMTADRVAGIGRAFAAGQGNEVAARAPASARDAVQHAFAASFTSGLNHILVVGAIVCFAGAACALALVRRQDFVTGAPAAAPA
jgi:EmrB/QacA subfamily drug resistance transporter